MSSKLRRSRFAATLLALVVAAPVTVLAQEHPYLAQWGTYGSGDGQFNSPNGVAVDASGNVYVTDIGNHRVQKFTSDGVYLGQWGEAGSGNGQFAYPRGIAIDASGNVLVADGDNRRVQKFTGSGDYVTQWSVGDFCDGLAVDNSGNVYVALAALFGQVHVAKFSSTGTLITQWGSSGDGDGQFRFASGVATNSAGDVFVTDHQAGGAGVHNRVQKFDGGGTYLSQWGTFGLGNGEFFGPAGIATDMFGNVFVVDYGNRRVQRFNDNGVYLAKWGSSGSGDGQFRDPSGVATDAAGNVYVADSSNNRIQKFGPASTPVRSTSWGRLKALYR